MRRPLMLGGALLAAVLLSSCGYNAPSDMIALEIGAGPSEAKKIKDCKDPGTRDRWFTNDDYVYLPGPTNEREWDATGASDSDADPMQSVTHDHVIMDIPVTIRLNLKSDDCDLMKQFYVNYVRRYHAEFEEDGTYNAQWESVMRRLVGDPSDATLDRIIQQFDWRDVWNDPATKVDIENQMKEALASDSSLMVQAAHDAYFDNITVIVGQPKPEDPALAAAVAEEQTNVAKAQSLEAQARADIAVAKAETARAKAEAAKQRAEIAGFRLSGMSAKEAMRAYNEAQLIASGGNPYQPQYLVGGVTGP